MRGFHQGDPIGPFLFLMVMEHFSTLLHHEVSHRALCPLLIGPVAFTHALFTDDILIAVCGDR